MSTTKGTTCSIEGCDRPVDARGWCTTHWKRWRTHGDPLRERPTAEVRFWAKVDRRGPDECWLWIASCFPNGYGQFGVGGRAGHKTLAHRFAYGLLVEPIPKATHLHHVCEVRACVNPAHLDPVTPGEHLRLHDAVAARDAAMAARTTCARGHAKDVYGHHDGKWWHCRECRRLCTRRRRAATSQKTSRAI